MTITDLRRAYFRFEHKYARQPKHFVVTPDDGVEILDSLVTGALGADGRTTILGMTFSYSIDVTPGKVLFAIDEIDAL